ncbi:redoxin domain-containing protein [Arenimonas sp.]|uniref:redoxin domain-containing protein n=1 Tax=Arenimonas sp. TaxID=1872635 RepID=UPI0039E64390
MKTRLLATALVGALAFAAYEDPAAKDAAAATAAVGKPAPAFALIDSTGKKHALADYAGKTVVLEWNNPECPFVKKHYGAGNMQAQQRAATAAGVVWLTINSSADGKQGHMDAAQAQATRTRLGAAQSAYLFDPQGSVGRAYAAKTTPHMYIIDGRGLLRYAGAIDSNPSSDPGDIAAATQYVPKALAELKAGKPVSVALTRPYGCSVKYAD